MTDSGGPASDSTYGTIRKSLKATTNKLMIATTIKKPPMPLSVERSTTDRADAGRFMEGVSFKGKLIGVLEVTEARGDRMCQEALVELKIAVRAAGEHKQKIAITVAMDGIRLRDERSGDCLYHHPVHKISFIAQDMTDTRAFGYICGSPDSGHKFFGIKTEKAASQVVIAMRDLFQVVFELKKKEVEKARAQLKEGKDAGEFKDSSYGMFGANGESGIVSSSLTLGAGGPIADLLDLQSELTSLQRGLSEITKRAQGASLKTNSKDDLADPFGDSFRPTNTEGPQASGGSSGPSSLSLSTSSVPTIPAPLAPPPSVRRGDSQKSTDKGLSEFGKFPVDFKNLNQNSRDEERYLSLKDPRSDKGYSSLRKKRVESESKLDDFDDQWSLAETTSACSESFHEGGDVFTELDPLGTGKIKPFVDKKDFFTEIRKANSRKLLRELGDGEEVSTPRAQPGVIPAEVSALVASSSLYCSSNNPSTNVSQQSGTIATPSHGSIMPSLSDTYHVPRKCFEDHRRSSSREHLEPAGFADFNVFSDSPKSQRSDISGSNFEETSASVGSLNVALPPESFRDSPPPFSPPPPPHSTSNSSSPCAGRSPVRNKFPNRSLTLSSSSVSPKTLPRNHKFDRQMSCDEWEFRDDSPLRSLEGQVRGSGISPRPRPRSSLSKPTRIHASTLPYKKRSPRGVSASPTFECAPFPVQEVKFEEAPEPPPRPAQSQPPPLPPKRLPSHITLKPPPRPPPSSDSHYIYINEYDSSPEHTDSPPIPIPARKPKHSDSYSRRSGKCEYQFPKTSHSPTREVSPNFQRNGSRSSLSSRSSTPGSRLGVLPADVGNKSLDQLAAQLHIPIEQLAKMTVVELADCLTQLQLKEESSKQSDEWDHQFPSGDDDMFAKFDSKFPKSPTGISNFKDKVKYPLGAPVSEDRYAVFKELSGAGKQKSVFDENFLTPQNSMEDEVSDVSSSTFKVNFNEDFYTDSVEQKSSISDDIDAGELNRKDEWESTERMDHECVTVFRSPDISEYENFEPTFECKFEDDFSAASLSERTTPVGFNVNPKAQTPFADDFNNSVTSDRFAKVPKDEKFVANFNVPVSARNQRNHSASEVFKDDASQKSPFEDDFAGYIATGNRSDELPRRKRDSLGRRNRKRSSLEARSSEKSVSPFDDDFTQRTDKYEVLRDLDTDKDGDTGSHGASPFEDSWNRNVDDQKSIGSRHSEDRTSPVDHTRKIPDELDRTRRSSDIRASFSEPLTPSLGKPRRISIGSEDSLDVRNSPFEDNFNDIRAPDVRSKSQSSEVFEESKDFADFDNAFQKVEEPEIFPDIQTEFKVSARFSKPDSTETIFRRESDPFADDFFSEENGSAKDPFWQDNFDNFHFNKNV